MTILCLTDAVLENIVGGSGNDVIYFEDGDIRQDMSQVPADTHSYFFYPSPIAINVADAPGKGLEVALNK